MMLWNEAKRRICAGLTKNLKIDTGKSHGRVVLSCPDNCEADSCYKVKIGETTNIRVSLRMLEVVFESLSTEEGYCKKSLKCEFAKAVNNHSCYVHVIGQLMVKAGLASLSTDKQHYFVCES